MAQISNTQHISSKRVKQHIAYPIYYKGLFWLWTPPTGDDVTM